MVTEVSGALAARLARLEAKEVAREQKAEMKTAMGRQALADVVAGAYGTVITAQVAFFYLFGMTNEALIYGAAAFGSGIVIAAGGMALAGVEKTKIAAQLARFTAIAVGTPVAVLLFAGALKNTDG